MKKGEQPKFPEIFNGYNICWGVGNKVVGPRLLASIPVFTLYPEGSKKRSSLEKKYWQQQQKKYNEAKELYEKTVFIGTIWKGTTNISARITKIVCQSDKQYICYKASHETLRYIEKENRKMKKGLKMKPPPPDRISLPSFLSMIRNKQVTIITQKEK